MDSGTKKCNYRQLQAVAKKMHLPGNLKHQLLLQLIEARNNGNECLVEQILAEQKVERAKRKSEKLEAKEAAYKHLKLPQEKRAGGRPKKYNTTPKDSNVPLKSNDTCCQDSQIRSLLKMSPHSIRQLLKQQSMSSSVPPNDHAPQTHQRDIYPEGNLYYNQGGYMQLPVTSQPYTDDFPYQQKMRTQQVGSSSKSFDLSSGGSYDYRNNETRKSFQMRDILSTDDDTNYSHLPTGVHPTLPPTSSLYEFGSSYPNDLIPPLSISDPLSSSTLSYYPSTSYSSTPQDYWGMPLYGSKPLYQDNCLRRYEPYNTYSNVNLYQDANIGTPNSDTLSAPEQELDLVFPYEHEIPDIKPNNLCQPPYPVICSYLASGETQMFNATPVSLSEAETYITPDNPSPNGGELILSESLTPISNSSLTTMDRTQTDLSSNVRFLSVVDHQEWRTYEYSAPVQPYSNYYHSVSSHHSYIQLK